jgi:TolB-like protein/DNA-binding winged helix-turn-helix (wHTH) protein
MDVPPRRVLRVGEWRVDPSLDEISQGAHLVKLEPRTMRLLLCLAERAGEVVSIQQLLDHVWPEVVVTHDSVYQSVAALRRTLGDHSREPSYIANVPRRGYRLVAPVAPWPATPAAPPAAPVADAGSATAPATQPPRVARAGARLHWIRYALAIALVVAIASAFTIRLRPDRPAAWLAQAPPSTAAPSDKSIAVLPFVDMSEQRDEEFFADGMAEEIIDRLASVPELRVPARTSSFYFKGQSKKITDIARELHVAHVLEGSVRKSGDRLRVTAELVRADTGYHVWSETYDRQLRDVFRVQDEIANAVVQTLQITLLGGPLTRPRGGTQNLEAYQLYLRSRDALAQNSRASLEAAREHAARAVALDPGFGLGWLALARQAQLWTDASSVPPKEGYERARQLALQTLDLSPDLTEAHDVLLYVHSTYDWDWAAAEAERQHVLALDPNNLAMLSDAGRLSGTLGRWDEAERQFDAVLGRDPLNAVAHFNLGTMRYNAGRLAQAEASFRRVLALAPAYLYGHVYLAKTLLALGRVPEAVAEAEREQDTEARLCILPITYWAAGRRAESDEALAALGSRYAQGDAYFLALAHAYRGDRDKAFQWLDRAYRQKDVTLVEIVGERLFGNLTGDRRYKAFLRRMNLPQ